MLSDNSPSAATILLVDDEPLMRKVMQATLARAGFSLLEATDGKDGCAKIDELDGRPLDLVITDVDMPGCSGIELARYARTHRPGIHVLVISANPMDMRKHAGLFNSEIRFLGKPFTRGALLETIRLLTPRYPGQEPADSQTNTGPF